MSKKEKVPNLPLFVSFPRSGCNWLQAVMELYFDRHRALKHKAAPSWLEEKEEEPMWQHTHDPNGTVVTTYPVVFLYRYPPDAIFSLCDLLHDYKPKSIERFCSEYKRLFEKWTKPENTEVHGGGKVLVVRYKNVVKNPHEEMKRISEFFEEPFRLARSKKAFEIVGNKKNVYEKNGPAQFKNPRCQSEDYANSRKTFKEQWEEKILERTGFAKEDE